MENKASLDRLGICLLALMLVFIGAQILDWTPEVSAQVTTGSTADLVWVSNPNRAIPAADTTDVQMWGTTINTAGIFRLATNLQSASGTGVIIAANNVTLLGNGKTIRGDGNFTETSNKETGISVGNNSNVIISGVHLAQLDTGISGANSSPVQGNSVSNVSVDTTKTGIYWMNQSTAQNMNFDFNTFNYVRDYGVYWSNNMSASRSDSVRMRSNRLTNTGANGGNGYGIYVSDAGVAKNTSITSNTFSGNKKDVVVHNSSDSLVGLNVSHNVFQNSGQNVYISNGGGSDRLSNVMVSQNTFQDNRYPYTPYPEMPAGHINFFGGGNGIQITGNTISGNPDMMSLNNMSGIRFAGMYLDTGVPPPYPFYNLVIRYNTLQYLTGNDGTGKVAGIHFYNMSESVASPQPARAVLTSAQPTVRDNAFISNSGPGISYTKGVSNPLATIVAQYNYWGNPNGPQPGDVAGDVDYSNWLTAPPQTNLIHLPLVVR